MEVDVVYNRNGALLEEGCGPVVEKFFFKQEEEIILTQKNRATAGPGIQYTRSIQRPA